MAAPCRKRGRKRREEVQGVLVGWRAGEPGGPVPLTLRAASEAPAGPTDSPLGAGSASSGCCLCFLLKQC